MRGIIGLILLFSTPLPLGATPPVQPTEMITIAPGEFIMGSSEKDIEWAAQTFFSESLDYYRDETPAHTVHLKAYKIDKTEVTVAQYRLYREQTGTPAPKFMDNERFNQDQQPVVGVTWQEAADYCATMRKRLPTEAEWEKAARGTDGRYYPWGNEPDETKANVRGKQDGCQLLWHSRYGRQCLGMDGRLVSAVSGEYPSQRFLRKTIQGDQRRLVVFQHGSGKDHGAGQKPAGPPQQLSRLPMREIVYSEKIKQPN
jgi:formylglycine-generating enzyme required for sulfatase activity